MPTLYLYSQADPDHDDVQYKQDENTSKTKTKMRIVTKAPSIVPEKAKLKTNGVRTKATAVTASIGR